MQVKTVYGEEKKKLDKVKLMDLEIFISEYNGKGCIGLGVVSDEVGMSALCESMGIDPKELGMHVKTMTQALGQAFTETIDHLSTKTKDAERMN